MPEPSQRQNPKATGGRAVTKPPPRPPRRPLPSPLAVITTTLGLFLVVLTLLAIQVRLGRDPALGAGPVVPANSQPLVKGTQAQQATKIVTRTSPVKP